MAHHDLVRRVRQAENIFLCSIFSAEFWRFRSESNPRVIRKHCSLWFFCGALGSILQCDRYADIWDSNMAMASSRWFGLLFEINPVPFTHLLVQELSRVLLNVALIQVSSQAHQADLGQSKVCQLDMTHGGDEQTRREKAHSYTCILTNQHILSITQNHFFYWKLSTDSQKHTFIHWISELNIFFIN